MVTSLAVTHLVPNKYGPQTFGPPQMVPKKFCLFMGTGCDNLGIWGPNWLGTKLVRDQIGWGPFVHGDQIFGDHLSRGTELVGDRLSRGTNQLGTNCGGPNVRGP